MEKGRRVDNKFGRKEPAHAFRWFEKQFQPNSTGEYQFTWNYWLRHLAIRMKYFLENTKSEDCRILQIEESGGGKLKVFQLENNQTVIILF